MFIISWVFVVHSLYTKIDLMKTFCFSILCTLAAFNSHFSPLLLPPISPGKMFMFKENIASSFNNKILNVLEHANTVDIGGIISYSYLNFLFLVPDLYHSITFRTQCLIPFHLQVCTQTKFQSKELVNCVTYLQKCFSQCIFIKPLNIFDALH